MLKLNLLAALKARWIKQPYGFLVNNGFSPTLAAKMSHEKVASIRLDHLEKLCLLLNCTPNDLLRFTPDKNQVVPENHALHQLKKGEMEEIVDWLSSIHSLPLADMAKLSKKMKED